jgi:hypothetical protein
MGVEAKVGHGYSVGMDDIEIRIMSQTRSRRPSSPYCWAVPNHLPVNQDIFETLSVYYLAVDLPSRNQFPAHTWPALDASHNLCPDCSYQQQLNHLNLRRNKAMYEMRFFTPTGYSTYTTS